MDSGIFVNLVLQNQIYAFCSLTYFFYEKALNGDYDCSNRSEGLELSLKNWQSQKSMNNLLAVNKALDKIDCDLFIKEISASFYNVKIIWKDGQLDRTNYVSKDSPKATVKEQIESLNKENQLNSFYNKLEELTEDYDKKVINEFWNEYTLIDEDGNYFIKTKDGKVVSISPDTAKTLEEIREHTNSINNYIKKIDNNGDGIFDEVYTESPTGSTTIYLNKESEMGVRYSEQKMEDGSQILMIDSNDNGKFDTKVIIQKNGLSKYILLDENDESSLIPDYQNSLWDKVEEERVFNDFMIVGSPILENQKSRFYDRYGSGQFLAPRKKESGETYEHNGLDIISTPGEIVYSPIDGKILRNVFPYKKNKNLEGVQIIGTGKYEGYIVTMFYSQGTIMGKIKAGENIGIAQDLRKKYPNITNHVHLKIRYLGVLIDPLEFFKMSF